MVNVRAIANRQTSGINPNTVAQLRAFQSYAVLPSGKTASTYAAASPIVIQAQALSKKEVEHIDAMNLSPCERAAYANGQLQAYDRVAQTGGDMLLFEIRWWRVMAVLEGWSTAGWCKVALVGAAGPPA